MSHESHASTFAATHESDVGKARDPGVFASTHWSVVRRAGSNTTTESMAALERLCRQYWLPLYYFVRRRGYNEQDAQDLTQGFFAQLLEKSSLNAADRERGRFRTFLLTALQNYIANEWDKAHRQKRGGGQQFVSLESTVEAEAGYRSLPSDTSSPDQLFERRWAQAVIEAVLKRLREECERRDGKGRFDILKEFLFTDRGEVSYAETAAGLGVSEAATKSAIYRLRQRYGQIFAEEIAQTLESPDQVDDEIRYLLTVLEGPG